MKLRRILAVTGLTILAGIVVAFCVLRASSVPIGEVAFTPTHVFMEVPSDPIISQMIDRAKRDYFISPIPGHRGKLTFRQVLFGAPDDVYLRFSTSDRDDVIMYYGTRHDQRLHSKWFAKTVNVRT